MKAMGIGLLGTMLLGTYLYLAMPGPEALNSPDRTYWQGPPWSAVEQAAYARSSGTLRLSYRSGQRATYRDISPSEFAAFLRSAQKGRFFQGRLASLRAVVRPQ
jgi:hypothetical protein